MSSVPPVPNSPTASSAALPGAPSGLTGVVSRIKDASSGVMKQSKPWSEVFDRTVINKPTSFGEVRASAHVTHLPLRSFGMAFLTKLLRPHAGTDQDQKEFSLFPGELSSCHASHMRSNVCAPPHCIDRARLGPCWMDLGALHPHDPHCHQWQDPLRQGDYAWPLSYLVHHNLLLDKVRQPWEYA